MCGNRWPLGTRPVRTGEGLGERRCSRPPVCQRHSTDASPGRTASLSPSPRLNSDGGQFLTPPGILPIRQAVRASTLIYEPARLFRKLTNVELRRQSAEVSYASASDSVAWRSEVCAPGTGARGVNTPRVDPGELRAFAGPSCGSSGVRWLVIGSLDRLAVVEPA